MTFDAVGAPEWTSGEEVVLAVMWYWGHGDVHWWGWFVGALAMVVFWGVVIWLIVGLVRGGSPRRNPGPGRHDETPKAILKRRFAAGEIDEEEYRRRLDLLREHEQTPTG